MATSKQVAWSFDAVTVRKIVKGFLFALAGGVAVGIVAWLQGIEAAKALLLVFVGTATPAIANGFLELKEGS
jgi:hypothetical protein